MNNVSLFDAIASDLASAKWIFAKTMPKHPHHYTLRAEWSGKVPFDTVVGFMRGHGYDEMFFRKKMRRFNANGMKYWTMGFPVDRTRLINRAELTGTEANTNDSDPKSCHYSGDH